ncbi:hypothetical protein DV738_g1154, partial [Chaetothyriales sp. CBS 135597]
MSYGPQGNQYGAPPPQQGWGGAQPPPQQWGPPAQQWGPPAQQWGPPAHQSGPPAQQWGAPVHQSGPPAQQWGGAPAHQSGPPAQQWGGAPTQQSGPPAQQWGAPQVHPAPPSPGYDPNVIAQGDASRDAKALRAAMKGFGTDERALITILAKPDPLQMALLRNTYNSIHRRDLLSDVESETSGYFRDGLMSLVRGPLAQDTYNINKAIKGLGTKESLLNDVLIGRTNADMRAIKQAYSSTYHRTMESDIRGDLSMKTEKLFDLILAATRAEETTPIIPQEIERHVGDLYAATIGRSQGADQITVCGILTSGSNGQIRAIAQQFEARYHTSLIKALERRFDGHMEDALVLLIKRACDPAMTDAEQLESAMSGIGTEDFLLVQRVVRIHWNRQHLDQVKRAYQHRYKKDLVGRVKGEISNKYYEALMVACLS